MATSPGRVAESVSSARLAEARMNDVVRERLYPQLDYLFEKIRADKAAVTLDGVAAFNGGGKLLPREIYAGPVPSFPDQPPEPARLPRYPQGKRGVSGV